MSTRLPTIAEVIALSEPSLVPASEEDGTQAEQEWRAAIAALSQLLQHLAFYQSAASSKCSSSSSDSEDFEGVVLTGPAPVLSDPNLMPTFSTWIFTPLCSSPTAPQLPAQKQAAIVEGQTANVVPLLPRDSIAAEQFCLVLTAQFSLVMALVQTPKGQSFLYSFAPEVVQRAWTVLRLRVLQVAQAAQLDTLAQQFVPTEPHYTTVTQFSRLLLKHLAAPTRQGSSCSQVSPNRAEVNSSQSRLPQSAASPVDSLAEPVPSEGCFQSAETKPGHADQFQDKSQPLLSEFDVSSDLELLQAIAHEVRTPLATISTLTRLLLKRPDLPAEVIKRLEAIYRECSEQIDRFSLIFRAAELETTQRRQQRSPVRRETAPESALQLTSVSLAQVLQQSVPRWQRQAARRNLKLQVSLPQQMPAVVSDPTVLDQVLTGLIDRFARSLPTGSHIHLQVALAGDQLKLQLQPHCNSATDEVDPDLVTPVLKSVGQLLMLQPETGTLSLSLPVTKNLFQALGGKLTVRRRPQQGEVFTIFLPLGHDSSPYQ